jgi:hypothetical protein
MCVSTVVNSVMLEPLEVSYTDKPNKSLYTWVIVIVIVMVIVMVMVMVMVVLMVMVMMTQSVARVR